MQKFIKLFIKTNCKNNKKFSIVDLENFITDRCGGQSSYYELGGYDVFYSEIQKLKKQGRIREIKSSGTNNRMNAPMKLRWILINDEVNGSWKDEDIIRCSDILNFKTYNNHPEYETKMEWEYIKNIYKFLKERENRQWASLEERCLELFYDEKFLTDNDRGKKDNKVLKRLGITLHDIKARRYGEQFIYWNKGVKNIKTIIILENHSTFFSFKKAVQNGLGIFGVNPDALIFGYGKKIIKSFSFIDEIADPKCIEVYYFGDMDPEGYFIYGSLKEKYNNIDIRLFAKAYVELIKLCHRKYRGKQQNKNEKYLNIILQEFNAYKFGHYSDYIVELWNGNLRIPQELITYEHLLKLKGEI